MQLLLPVIDSAYFTDCACVRTKNTLCATEHIYAYWNYQLKVVVTKFRNISKEIL